ncbi:pentatricopeptide repeat-containing protein At2g22410, mitochondrial isoform X1 [Jatropha curcas]|uniref:pentatricopeptide repeat-containing protein At2g22410, mitochondrial isoform X1 n=1 Tax=Jatropha curcas TaxID=180498 RepID=UPI0005FAC488|nr:pentatricopeptide repeat-containing protein At2g22410, mitochondrial isoform X1 [Jatropha curcas]
MVFPFKCLTVASRLNRAFSSIHQFESENQQILHSLLEKCSSIKELKQIHAQIVLNGLNHQTLTISKVISFCAVTDTRNLDYAQLVFNQITQPNKFMYNSLIRGYSNSNEPIKSILLYRQMIDSGLSPNEFTLPFVLKACASKSAFWVSLLVYGQAQKLGLGCHVCVQNGLINAFIWCGFINFAKNVFDDMSERTLVSWNSMIGGYAKVGWCKEAFLLFKDMRETRIEPDKFTLVNLLTVCSQSCNIHLGRFLHLHIEITGLEIDLIVRNALLDMYAKCGHLQLAERLFDQMSDKNVVSWTSMISAYAKHGLVEFAQKKFDKMTMKNVVSWNSMISCHVQAGQCKEALNLFHGMHNLGVMPNESTLVCVLSACSQIGDLVTGKKIHRYICSISSIDSVNLWNSVIDMYAKCGALGLAIDIFNKMPTKNLVSWNAIIGALALHGCGLEAIKLFEKMQAEGICPDEITFTLLLSACSHCGLVDIGRDYFYKMRSVYGIVHEIEHYACMVDLLGRGGRLDEAMMLIRGMPMKPDIVIWGALLGACRTHGDVRIGKQILKQLLELKPSGSGVYVLLSNLFFEAGKWEGMKNIRKLMNNHEIIKCRGISSIEVEGCIYEFMVDDSRLEVSSNVYSLLDQLTDHMTSIGYFCNFSSVFSESHEM